MIKYKKYFSVKLSHEYYADGTCPDFRIQPTNACNQLLKNHNCLFRFNSSLLEIWIESENDAFIYPPVDDTIFDFDILLINRDFNKYTTISSPPPGDILLFDNRSLTLIENQDLIQNSTRKRNAKAYGKIEIVNNDSISANAAQSTSFTISFSAVSAPIKYYLLTENSEDVFSIEDEENGITFSKIDLSSTSSVNDTVAQNLEERFPTAERFLFESNLPLKYKERQIRHFQLKRNDIIVMNNLNIPTYDTNGIYLINAIN